MSNLAQRYRTLGASLFGLAAAFALGSAQSQDVLDTTIQTQTQMNEQAEQSQDRIDQLAEETSDMLTEYRTLLRQIESLKTYNAQLERVTANQRQEMQSIEQQLTELEDTNRDVVPLMIEMVDMLDRLVNNDIPFLIEERRQRVNELKAMLDRADVTTSEKYRRIMEAYTVEMSYGRDVYSYRGELPESGRTVNFLHVGRTLLFYQTLDGEDSGWWNRQTNQFEPISDAYDYPLTQGIRIAQQQVAPDLIKLPVPGPERAQ